MHDDRPFVVFYGNGVIGLELSKEVPVAPLQILREGVYLRNPKGLWHYYVIHGGIRAIKKVGSVRHLNHLVQKARKNNAERD